MRKEQIIENQVFGCKKADSMIFKHTGNWAYRPALFYSCNLVNAVSTAMNIESSLYVWNEEKEEWDIVIDIDSVWCIGDEEDENGDIAIQNINYDIKNAGFDTTFEELRKKKGRIIRSAYQGWRREDIPEGAYELAPGLFI